jgi:hypothetical protein
MAITAQDLPMNLIVVMAFRCSHHCQEFSTESGDFTVTASNHLTHTLMTANASLAACRTHIIGRITHEATDGHTHLAHRSTRQ